MQVAQSKVAIKFIAAR